MYMALALFTMHIRDKAASGAVGGWRGGPGTLLRGAVLLAGRSV